MVLHLRMVWLRFPAGQLCKRGMRSIGSTLGILNVACSNTSVVQSKLACRWVMPGAQLPGNPALLAWQGIADPRQGAVCGASMRERESAFLTQGVFNLGNGCNFVINQGAFVFSTEVFYTVHEKCVIWKNYVWISKWCFQAKAHLPFHFIVYWLLEILSYSVVLVVVERG